MSRVCGLRRERRGKKDVEGKSGPWVYMCIQWTANSFSLYKCSPKFNHDVTMNLLWTQVCQPPLQSPSLFTLQGSLPVSPHCPPIFSHSVPIFFLVPVSSSLAKRCSWQHVYSLTLPHWQGTPPPPPPLALRFPVNQASWRIHKLLTAIWNVSGITRTVLIRTSWHILAEACTYGNSIRKRRGEGQGRGIEKKGHTEGSRVWDREIRKTEGGKWRQWADGRLR